MNTVKTILLPFLVATSMIFFANCGGSSSDDTAGPDSTGLGGDHFNLAAALELFKNSKSPEDFEKKLNSKETNVNNLDLNGDNKIDYIRVVDNMKGNAHAIVLQVPISEKESQDVAVIEIEKKGDKQAEIQIVGNELLYGDSNIVEPKSENSEQKASMVPGIFTQGVSVEVNVWPWPMVGYLYEPDYVVWASPWRWAVYPEWWSPWPPYPWGWYRSRMAHYNNGYGRGKFYRMPMAEQLYFPGRRNSMFVMNRYNDVYKMHGGPKMRGGPFEFGHGHGGPEKMHGEHGDHGMMGRPEHGMKGGHGGMGGHSGGNMPMMPGERGPKGGGGSMPGGHGGPAGGGGHGGSGGGGHGGGSGGHGGGGGRK